MALHCGGCRQVYRALFAAVRTSAASSARLMPGTRAMEERGNDQNLEVLFDFLDRNTFTADLRGDKPEAVSA